MRFPKYMSPSSFQLFQSNREKYFIKYMSGIKVPSVQTQAMALGSGFDALVKDQMSRDLGLGALDLFKEQVGEEHYDWCVLHARNVYKQYHESGAYVSLMAYLEQSLVTPKFEFKLTRIVNGVPILGYPDVFFVTSDGLPVVVDFKVNGYCGRAVKPKQTYIESWPKIVRKKHVGQRNYRGIMIHSGEYFEAVNKVWANQMIMYAWMLGAEEDFVVSIEQLACADKVVVARHAGRVSKAYQDWLMTALADAWAVICSGKVCEGQEKILQQADDPLYKLLIK